MKPEEFKLSAVIVLRVEQRDKEMIRRAAADDGMQVSEWLRWLASKRQIEHERPGRPRKPTKAKP